MDALIGGGLALGLIAAAHAALPDFKVTSSQPSFSRLMAGPSVGPSPAPGPLISFQDPLPGYGIGSPFGLRQLPWEEGGRLHAGVDIAAPGGEPIRAVADGVVVQVGQGGGLGRFVELRHAEGLKTIYGHMGGLADGLAPGMAVKAGQPVGRNGSTGTSTGSHLHFEIRDAKDRPLNPELFLGKSFATAEELPIRKAQRIPRQVRVAYVSMVPKSKKEQMEAKILADLDAELAAIEAAEQAKAAKAAKVAARQAKLATVAAPATDAAAMAAAPGAAQAASAEQAGSDAAAATQAPSSPEARVRSRLSVRQDSPKTSATETPAAR
jgi:hypothetical protein